MEDNIKVIIVDDNIQFRKHFKNYIENKLNYKVIAEASNGIEFLKLSNIYRADIVLMDIAMDEMDGFETTKRAIWDYNKIQVIAVTMHSEKVFLIKLIETGFKGCVFKNRIFEDLPKAIDEVLQGDLFFPDGINFKKTFNENGSEKE